MDLVGCVVDATGNSLADAARTATGQVFKATMAWWMDLPSVDVAHSPAPLVQQLLLPLTAMLTASGFIWTGIRVAFWRKAEPLVDVWRAMWTLAAVTAVGLTATAAAINLSDILVNWWLDEATRSAAADRITSLVMLSSITNPWLVLIVCSAFLIVGIVQAILMLFRQGTLTLLTGTLQLAAAGSFLEATKSWMPRVLGWMLALILFKPAAAMVYVAVFLLVGDGKDLPTVFTGLALLVLSLFALPALTKLFSMGFDRGMGGGGGAMLGAVAGAGLGMLAARGSAPAPPAGTPAQGQTENVTRDLGPSGGSTSPGGADVTVPMPAPTGAAESAGVAEGTGAASGAVSGGAGGAAGGAAAGCAAAAGPAAVAVVAVHAVKGAAEAAKGESLGAMGVNE